MQLLGWGASYGTWLGLRPRRRCSGSSLLAVAVGGPLAGDGARPTTRSRARPQSGVMILIRLLPTLRRATVIVSCPTGHWCRRLACRARRAPATSRRRWSVRARYCRPRRGHSAGPSVSDTRDASRIRSPCSTMRPRVRSRYSVGAVMAPPVGSYPSPRPIDPHRRRPEPIPRPPTRTPTCEHSAPAPAPRFCGWGTRWWVPGARMLGCGGVVGGCRYGVKAEACGGVAAGGIPLGGRRRYGLAVSEIGDCPRSRSKEEPTP